MTTDTTPDVDETDRYIATCFAELGSIATLNEIQSMAETFPIIRDLHERAKTNIGWVIRHKFRHEEVLEFRYIKSMAFNAAASSGILSVIGMTVGVPCRLPEVFARLLASKNALPYVGNVSLEDSDFQHRSVPLRDSSPLVEYQHPRCPVRHALVGRLSQMAFDYLLGHEIGHIARGHNAIDASTQRVFSESAQDSHNRFVDQALELDADFFGVMELLRRGFDLMKTLQDGIEPSGSAALVAAHRAAFKDPETTLETVAFSIWVLMRTLSDAGASSLTERTHPPLALRANFLIGMAHTLVTQFPSFGLTEHGARAAIDRAIVSAEDAIAACCSESEARVRLGLPQHLHEHWELLTEKIERLDPVLSEKQVIEGIFAQRIFSDSGAT